MIVLDVSAAAAWFLEDEANKQVDNLLTQGDEAQFLAPALWIYELGSVLLQAWKRGRITAAQIQADIVIIEQLGVEVEPLAPPLGRIIELSQTYNLTAYDAAYLELAIRKGAELATLDQQLAAAAEQSGVRLAL